jgi:hypothetical protein
MLAHPRMATGNMVGERKFIGPVFRLGIAWYGIGSRRPAMLKPIRGLRFEPTREPVLRASIRCGLADKAMG